MFRFHFNRSRTSVFILWLAVFVFSFQKYVAFPSTNDHLIKPTLEEEKASLAGELDQDLLPNDEDWDIHSIFSKEEIRHDEHNPNFFHTRQLLAKITPSNYTRPYLQRNQEQVKGVKYVDLEFHGRSVVINGVHIVAVPWVKKSSTSYSSNPFYVYFIQPLDGHARPFEKESEVLAILKLYSSFQPNQHIHFTVPSFFIAPLSTATSIHTQGLMKDTLHEEQNNKEVIFCLDEFKSFSQFHHPSSQFVNSNPRLVKRIIFDSNVYIAPEYLVFKELKVMSIEPHLMKGEETCASSFMEIIPHFAPDSVQETLSFFDTYKVDGRIVPSKRMFDFKTSLSEWVPNVHFIDIHTYGYVSQIDAFQFIQLSLTPPLKSTVVPQGELEEVDAGDQRMYLVFSTQTPTRLVSLTTHDLQQYLQSLKHQSSRPLLPLLVTLPSFSLPNSFPLVPFQPQHQGQEQGKSQVMCLDETKSIQTVTPDFTHQPSFSFFIYSPFSILVVNEKEEKVVYANHVESSSHVLRGNTPCIVDGE